MRKPVWNNHRYYLASHATQCGNRSRKGYEDHRDRRKPATVGGAIAQHHAIHTLGGTLGARGGEDGLQRLARYRYAKDSLSYQRRREARKNRQGEKRFRRQSRARLYRGAAFY